jgi:hypothetical protein
MTARWLVSAMVLGAMAAGCDAGEVAADVASDTGTPTEYTDWVPGATTTKKPAFGNACRLRVADHRERESNGATDDRVQITSVAAGAVTLQLAGRQGLDSVMDAQLTLAVARERLAYQQASGTASWAGDAPFGGQVVAGTLCFETELTAGAGVVGEFSIVVQDAGGAYHSMGGDFALPGSAVRAVAPTLDIGGDGVDVDFR